MSAIPIIFTWTDDGVMKPLARFGRQCDKQFVIGQNYRLIESEERSMASHNHFFAAVNDAWQNLPEEIAEQYPSAEHLRKRALIKAGFRIEKQIAASSHDDALRIAAFIGGIDEFAVVVVRDDVVKHFTAKSQSVRSMGKEEFQKSKQAVLDVLDDLLNLERGSLLRQQQSPSIAPEAEREEEMA